MNIALVGSSGYIAGYLIKKFELDEKIERILKIDNSISVDEKLDLNESELFNYESLNEIDYVIFTAAISGPDKCAEEFMKCWKINVEGTRYFIKRAIDKKCKVLFFSSDAVFGDIPGHIYDENSETRANTPYGMMKKAIEDEFKDSPLFKAIRLSYVTSARDRFVTYCLNCVNNNEVADVFHPFYRNCIVVSDVVNVVEWMIKYWDNYEAFVLNVAGKELVSRVRIADEINRCLGYKLNYKVSIPDDTFFQNRPKITQMKSLYLQKYNILNDSTFTEKIQKELKEI